MRIKDLYAKIRTARQMVHPCCRYILDHRADVCMNHRADVCMKRSFESEHYNLRSAVRGELVVPLARKSTLGHCSFKYSGPSLWNALSHDIRDPCLMFSQFRSGLKTLLYREAYYP